LKRELEGERERWKDKVEKEGKEGSLNIEIHKGKEGEREF
jgi:hypothetical protein